MRPDNDDVERLTAQILAHAESLRRAARELPDVLAGARCTAPRAGGPTAELRSTLADIDEALGGVERRLGIRPPGPRRRPGDAPRVHDLRGSTQTLRIADLIGMLSVQRATGTLWVHSALERFTLELRDGEVIHLATDNPGAADRLGAILVSLQHIGREQLEDFVDRHGDPSRPLGEQLRDAEIISEDDLRDGLQAQVRDLFQRLFQLEDAVFCFRAGVIGDRSLAVSMNVTELLLSCARWADERRWGSRRPAGSAGQ